MGKILFAAMATLCLSICPPAQAQWKKTDPSAADSFVFVPSDKWLKQGGITREQWNAKNPPSAEEWRKAWRVAGTSADNRFYRNLRRDCAPPPEYSSKKATG
ncbi:hypothetical protein [Asticcacaulis sp. W401b]|uniref:hypothetical protein n=1 Tax=Asticcacaulis sp. W401b TaxID=3388666 RepID=UPI003970DA07